jgi:hypothetical protein
MKRKRRSILPNICDFVPIVSIAASSFILLVPVLLNGFPFVFSDSGDYLVFTPRIYRSPYYGLLIFFFHLNRWIWLPLLMQAGVISHLLWLMLKFHHVRRPDAALIFLATILCLGSSLPFFVGFIMADLFTPIMMLAMYVLAFHDARLSASLKTYLVLLASVATAAHVSNLTVAAVLFGVIALLLWLRDRSRRVILHRLGVLLIPVGLTVGAVLLFNAAIFHVVSLVPSGSSFLMANLIQYGPARAYLEEVCPGAGYKVCRYADRLPATADEFLWTTGIFDELGGFVGMRSESKAIVDGTIEKDPGAVLAMMARNFLAGLVTHEPAAEFQRGFQVDSMKVLLAGKFGPSTLAAYLGSAEMRGLIPHEVIRHIDDVVVPVMFFALIGIGLYAARRGSAQSAILAAFVLCVVLENTFLCTAVSGVHNRYQARVTWLLPMAVTVIGLGLRSGGGECGQNKRVRATFRRRGQGPLPRVDLIG